MKQAHKLLAGSIATAALLFGAGSATAATAFTWEYVSNSTFSNTVSGSGTSTVGNGTTTLSGLTVQYTGWSNTAQSAGGSNSDGTSTARFDRQTLHGGAHNLSMYTNNGSASCSNTREASGCVGTGSPQHAIDNDDAQEFVLFVFSEAVVLNKLAIGWPDSGSGDTDMTAIAYTGDGVIPALTGLSSADILAGDFYIEHLADVPKDNTDGSKPYGNIANFNAGNVASQYWLIGAYNHHLGGSLTSKNDYIKLALLGGKTPDVPPPNTGVPEPTTLGLLGLGLLGLRGRARRAAANRG